MRAASRRGSRTTTSPSPARPACEERAGDPGGLAGAGRGLDDERPAPAQGGHDVGEDGVDGERAHGAFYHAPAERRRPRVAFVPAGRLPPAPGRPSPRRWSSRRWRSRLAMASESPRARASPGPGAPCGGAALRDARAGWDGPGRRRRGRASFVGTCERRGPTPSRRSALAASASDACAISPATAGAAVQARDAWPRRGRRAGSGAWARPQRDRAPLLAPRGCGAPSDEDAPTGAGATEGRRPRSRPLQATGSAGTVGFTARRISSSAASMVTWPPSFSSPKRIFSASGFFTFFWMRRAMGRAPMTPVEAVLGEPGPRRRR